MSNFVSQLLEMLEKEFKFYLDNQAEFVEKYDGKVVVIKDQTVVGVYETEIEAYSDSINKFEKGSFLIQQVASGKDNYSQTYYSRRVSF